MVFQFGSWFNGTGNIVGTVAASIVFVVFVYLLVRKNPNEGKINSSKRFAVDK